MQGHRGSQKGRPGRPPLDDSRSRRETIIRLRVNEDEELALRASAERAGLSLSAFLRQAGLGVRIHETVPEVNREAWLELARTAANLNQLVHEMHMNSVRFGPDVIGRAVEVVEATRREVGRLRVGLLGGWGAEE